MRLFKKNPEPLLAPLPDVPWASGAVFNPGAWFDGERVHLLFRAVPAGYQRVRLAYAEAGESAFGFDNYVSYIGYAVSRDGVNFDVRPEPLIAPDTDADRFGAEDPRITFLEGRYWITYSALQSPAFDPEARVRIGLASTTDFIQIEKHGVIGPDQRDKDAVLFPERVGGRVALLHRIVPDVQLAYFESVADLQRPPATMWSAHMASLDQHVVLRPQEAWEMRKVGAGPPPILTDEGWLLIYHGVDESHVYRAGLALLDHDDPSRVIARTRRPVLAPEHAFELHGDVDNVVFPEGAFVRDGILHIYYGAADRVIGHASAPLVDVLDALKMDRVDAL